MFTVDETTVELAPAKLNLILAVGEKRADGYHELAGVMQTIRWYDELTISVQASPGLDSSSVIVDAPQLPGGDTLVTSAISTLLRACGQHARVHVKLDKQIPHGAGLGGGSSDAATALIAVNRLLSSPLDSAELLDVGAAIGSDVPFFIAGNGCAVVRGRGEEVEPIAQAGPPRTWLVAWPGITSNTGEVYARYRPTRTSLADNRSLVSDYQNEHWYNDLSDSAIESAPQMRELRDLLTELLPDAPQLVAGSGSSIACDCNDVAVGILSDVVRELKVAAPLAVTRAC